MNKNTRARAMRSIKIPTSLTNKRVVAPGSGSPFTRQRLPKRTTARGLIAAKSPKQNKKSTRMKLIGAQPLEIKFSYIIHILQRMSRLC